MPLSELVPMRAKFEPKVDSMSDLPSYVPDAGFVELLWENGQIVMQGQSSKPKKNSIPSAFSTHLAKPLDKDGFEGVPTKIGRFVESHSGVNDFNEPNAQGDDMAPWLNYPIEDYSLDFLSEFPGGSMSPSAPENNSLQSYKDCNGFGLASRDAHNVAGSDPGRIRNVQFNQVPQQCSGSLSNPKSRNLDFSSVNNKAYGYNPVWGDSGNKPQRQEMGSLKPTLPPSSSSGLINFSHFSRPAVVKTNFQNIDRLKSNEKASTTTSTNFLESTLVESLVGLKSISQGHLAFESGKVDMKLVPRHPQEFVPVNRLEAIDRNRNIVTGKNKILPNIANGQKLGVTVNPPNPRHEKCSEPVVTSSSVCSGIGAGVGSNEPNHRAKRKIQEVEESVYHQNSGSEDLDDESIGIKKSSLTRGTTTKRTRAAEVHNLSERRRRDRINEKMRALQELIPNCNKVDKASMLDEAIEYLKSLQVQLQMMSMGSGLCMPAMMFPPGMQHIRSPHMPHFPHMGVGMGMGMGMGMGIGYGMGMVDMNGSPLIPVPQMHGPQLPFSIPGTSSVPVMSTPSSIPMFGIPGQNHPVSMMHGPSFIPPPVHSTVPSVPGAPVHAGEAAPCASTNEQRAGNFNPKINYKMEADDLRNPLSTQKKAEFCGESLKVETTDRASPNAKEAASYISGNENLTTSTSCC